MPHPAGGRITRCRELVGEHPLWIRWHELGIAPQAEAKLIIDEHTNLIRRLLAHVHGVGYENRMEVHTLRRVERRTGNDEQLGGESKDGDYQSLSPGGRSGGFWRSTLPSTSRSSRAALFNSSSA